MKNIILIIIASLTFFSCHEKIDNQCQVSRFKGINLEVGYLVNNNFREYYSIDSKSLAIRTKFEDGKSTILDTIKLDSVRLCELYQKSTNLFLKVQSLNVPADSNNYIVYRNTIDNVVLRALWNPVHSNKGNKEFKELYNEFIQLIKQ